MKKVICLLFAAALLLPILVVPAAASARYEFYYMEPVAMFDGSIEFGDDGLRFLYDGVLPNGRYSVIAYGNYNGYPVEVRLEPFEVILDSGSFSCETTCDVSLQPGFFVPCTVSLSIEDDCTCFVFLLDGWTVEEGAAILDSAVFYPMDADLSSVVTSDMLSDILGNVVALLPAVLFVAVGCVGLRKAIGFVVGLARSA